MQFKSPRKLIYTRTIDFAPGKWGNYDCARHWMRGKGYSVGPMQKGAPVALMLGKGICIAKWRNLTSSERDQVDAIIVSNIEHTFDAPVTISIFEASPALRRWFATRPMECFAPPEPVAETMPVDVPAEVMAAAMIRPGTLGGPA